MSDTELLFLNLFVTNEAVWRCTISYFINVLLLIGIRHGRTAVTRKTEIHPMTEIRRNLPKSAEKNTPNPHLIIILFEL